MRNFWGRARHGLAWSGTFVATLMAVGATVGGTNGEAAAATPRIDAQERAVVHRINQYRAAHHLPQVRVDARLTVAAEWMGRDLGRRGYFSHQDSTGRSPFERIAGFGYPSRTTWRGENLAAGRPGAAWAFRSRRASPEHDANMRDPHFRAIGVARVYVSGSPYGYYWVTDFGSRVVVPLH